MKTGILAISAQDPAKAWEKGCKSLGIEAGKIVINRNPKIKLIKDFFAQTPDWIYFGGHWLGYLYNNADNVKIRYWKKKVVVTIDGKKTHLEKGKGFKLHRNCKLVVWGGCSVCSEQDEVNTIRALFNNPIILGSSNMTDWRFNLAILTGKGNCNSRKKKKDPPVKSGFFNLLAKEKISDQESIKSAWLKSGYNCWKSERGRSWRMIDTDGVNWGMNRTGRIVRRKLD